MSNERSRYDGPVEPLLPVAYTVTMQGVAGAIWTLVALLLIAGLEINGVRHPAGAVTTITYGTITATALWLLRHTVSGAPRHLLTGLAITVVIGWVVSVLVMFA